MKKNKSDFENLFALAPREININATQDDKGEIIDSAIQERLFDYYSEYQKSVGKMSEDERLQLAAGLDRYSEFSAYMIGDIFYRVEQMIAADEGKYEQYKNIREYLSYAASITGISQSRGYNYLRLRKKADFETFRALGLTKTLEIIRIPWDEERAQIAKKAEKNNWTRERVKSEVNQYFVQYADERKEEREKAVKSALRRHRYSVELSGDNGVLLTAKNRAERDRLVDAIHTLRREIAETMDT